MSRFSSAAQTNTGHFGLSVPLPSAICCCCLTTAGGYSFTVPTFCSYAPVLGTPGLRAQVLGAGGSGATGSCVNSSLLPADGSNGNAGNLSCFGSVVAYGGGGGCRASGDLGCAYGTDKPCLVSYSGGRWYYGNFGSAGCCGTTLNSDRCCTCASWPVTSGWLTGSSCNNGFACLAINWNQFCAGFNIALIPCLNTTAGLGMIMNAGVGGNSGIGNACCAWYAGGACRQMMISHGSGGTGGIAFKYYISNASLGAGSSVAVCVGSGGASVASTDCACHTHSIAGGTGALIVNWYI